MTTVIDKSPFWSLLDCFLFFCRRFSLPLLPTACVRSTTLTSWYKPVQQCGFYGSNLLNFFLDENRHPEMFGRLHNWGREIKCQVNNHCEVVKHLFISLSLSTEYHYSQNAEFPGSIILLTTGCDGDSWSSSDLFRHSSRNSIFLRILHFFSTGQSS